MGAALNKDDVTPQHTDSTTVRLLPYHFAKAKGVITAREIEGEIEIWLAPNPESATLAEVRRMTGKALRPVLLSDADFKIHLARAYAGDASDNAQDFALDIASNINSASDLTLLTEALTDITDLLETENDAPIIKLINALLTQAVRENASDIHLEIFERRSLVRFRVDGALRDVVEPRRSLHAAIRRVPVDVSRRHN